MSQKTKEYRAILKLALEAQDAGDEDREEEMMSKLDKLWLSMTAAEVKETELISRELAQRAVVPTCALMITTESGATRVVVFPVSFKTTSNSISRRPFAPSQISQDFCFA